ncbi:putative aflatoxin efflux pump protein [Eutypa lata UCREL1]|uniref:Putative aflatoxin efflux pump protein n=1 Tax=Eutypa lata (strain UCR-EL1) TaxID=1287681 RepID=M7SXB2_EUTLA|nr:putative aflatoxin efflux pump protein [Eutypa lata UCREL1]
MASISDLEKTPDDGKPAPQTVDEAEENFKPKTLKFWTVLVSLFLAMFIVALDRTIIGTAIPQITQEFNSLGDIGWYGSAYQLTTAASQLVFGRIYKFYDTKNVFLVSVFIFEIGSLICGVAPNSVVFIVGRAIAGLGGAGLFTGVMIITISMIPLRKRPAFQGLFGSVFGIASVLGPLVGGGFTEGVTWRWCFYINLPIGGLVALCLIFLLHIPKNQQDSATFWQHFTRLDPLGTFFFVPSIVCLLLALQWGGSTYTWNNWRVILLLVLFGALLLAFVAVQLLMPDTASVPARIITRRSIFSGAIFTFCIAGSMLMTVYFTPLWFQVVQGQLGGAIFTSVGQNLLSSRLISQIGNIPGIDPSQIVSEGANDLVNNVAPEFRMQVKEAYNSSVTIIFLCGMGVALGGVVSALFMEWKNIKKGGAGGQPSAQPAQESTQKTPLSESQ